MALNSKRCPHCGKWFKALNNRRVYCHKDCRYEAFKLRNRKPKIIIYCLNCGKPKETSITTSKFCNRKCKNEYNHKRQVITYTCDYCGTISETTNKVRKYCDNNFCYYEAKRLRERRRYHGSNNS